MNKLEKNNNKTFEDIKHVDENEIEFWFARELQNVLDYREWRKFENVIKKAIVSCENSGISTFEHFVGVDKTINMPKGAKKTIQDYKLTRYACYLIAQNGDPRKEVIALAQTYFAVQTRKQEISEKEYNMLTEDEKRFYQRNLTKKGNLNWYRKNEYTPLGKVFDIGRTTIQALAKYELKLDEAKNCGEDDEYSNGNGSLMRMIPIAYYIYYKKIKDDKEIYNIVKDVSSITHRHEVSILGCYIYVSFILGLLNGLEKEQVYNNTKKMNYNYFSKDSLKRYDRILKGDITALNLDDINSDGYIVNTLECVLYMFLKSNDYNTTILEGVNLGNDTDTIGSCLGGLLGLYYGLDSIKESWRKNIIKYDYIIDLCNKFENIILGEKA